MSRRRTALSVTLLVVLALAGVLAFALKQVSAVCECIELSALDFSRDGLYEAREVVISGDVHIDEDAHVVIRADKLDLSGCTELAVFGHLQIEPLSGTETDHREDGDQLGICVLPAEKIRIFTKPLGELEFSGFHAKGGEPHIFSEPLSKLLLKNMSFERSEVHLSRLRVWECSFSWSHVKLRGVDLNNTNISDSSVSGYDSLEFISCSVERCKTKLSHDSSFRVKDSLIRGNINMPGRRTAISRIEILSSTIEFLPDLASYLDDPYPFPEDRNALGANEMIVDGSFISGSSLTLFWSNAKFNNVCFNMEKMRPSTMFRKHSTVINGLFVFFRGEKPVNEYRGYLPAYAFFCGNGTGGKVEVDPYSYIEGELSLDYEIVDEVSSTVARTYFTNIFYDFERDVFYDFDLGDPWRSKSTKQQLKECPFPAQVATEEKIREKLRYFILEKEDFSAAREYIERIKNRYPTGSEGVE